MNPHSSSRWQVKLGFLQILILLGVVTGSMLGAFGIGYVSGNAAGFETAQDSNVVTLARFPVERDEQDANYVSEVYAKLNDKKPTIKKKKELKKKEAKIEEAMPQNVPVMDAEDEEADDILDELTASDEEPSDQAIKVAEDLLKKESKAKDKADEGLTSDKAKEAGLDVALVGPPSQSASKTTTLGMLLEERKREREASQESDPKIAAPEVASKQEKASEQAVVLPKDPPKMEQAKSPEVKMPEVLKEEQAKKEEVPPTDPKKIATGWYAQVLAPKELSEAQALSDKLKDSGFPVVIEHAEVRGQQYYRVLVGGEESRQQAEILIKQLQREKYLKGDPFLRMIR